jgi:hypothetical protein
MKGKGGKDRIGQDRQSQGREGMDRCDGNSEGEMERRGEMLRGAGSASDRYPQ